MPWRGAALAAALLGATTVAPAHNEHPLGRAQIEWHGGPQILRTLAMNFDFHGGDNFITYRPHGRVERRDGRECLVGPYFLFDIDDRFAFDIDETVELEIVFDRQTSNGFNLSYDHAINPTALHRQFTTGTERWITERITLKRARFANRKYQHTDLSIGAPNSRFPPGDYRSGHEVAICGLTIRRPSPVSLAAASGSITLTLTDENEQPTTARVGIYRPDGKAPLTDRSAVTVLRFGERVKQLPLRYAQPSWPAPGRFVFYVDGAYHAALRPGRYRLLATRGPEYRRVEHDIEIKAGESLSLDLRFKRWRDLPAAGWYSGDDHIHVDRSDPVTNAAILAYTRAEDVHVSNLLQMGNVTTSHFPQYAFGVAGHYVRDSYALVAGQESPRTSHRGHTIGLNAKRFHWPGEDYFLYDKTADAIHADGGLFGYAHVALDAFNVAWGLALDVPLGLVDFFEMLQMNRMDTGYLYDFLNLGFRILPSAGSDYPYIHVAGTERVYAHLDGAFSVAAWFDAWRTRRSFVSNGPVIEFTLNDDAEANEFAVSRGTKLSFRATAGLNPDVDRLSRFELVQHGNVIASGSGDGDTWSLSHDVTVSGSTWFALRAFGAEKTKAHTAPIYVIVDGDQHTHDREQVRDLAVRYRGLLATLKGSRPSLDQEWERFNVEHDVLRKWDDDKPALDERIDRAVEIYNLLIEEAEGSIERL